MGTTRTHRMEGFMMGMLRLLGDEFRLLSLRNTLTPHTSLSHPLEALADEDASTDLPDPKAYHRSTENVTARPVVCDHASRRSLPPSECVEFFFTGLASVVLGHMTRDATGYSFPHATMRGHRCYV